MSQLRDSSDSSRFDLANYHRYRSLDRLRRRNPDDWRLTTHDKFVQEWDRFRREHADAYDHLNRQHNMHRISMLWRQLKSASVRLITNILVAATFLAVLAGLMHAIVTVIGR